MWHTKSLLSETEAAGKRGAAYKELMETAGKRVAARKESLSKTDLKLCVVGSTL